MHKFLLPFLFAFSSLSSALTLDCRLEDNQASGFLIYWDRDQAQVQPIDNERLRGPLWQGEFQEFSANLFIVKTSMRDGSRWGCYEIWIPLDANIEEEFPAHLFYCGNSDDNTRVKDLRAHLRCKLTSYSPPPPAWTER